MSTDASPVPGAEFPGRLFARLRDFLAETPDAPFSDVSMEESVDGRRADVFLDGHRAGGFVIEVRRDTVDPRRRDATAQARDYANDRGADSFAVCNSNDLFLFDHREAGGAAAEYYYLDLRARSLADAVPSVVGAVDRLYREGQLPHQSRRTQLLGTLRSFHGSTWPALRAAARDAYGSDQGFVEAFDEWVRTNDYRDRDRSAQFEIAAKQHAYLLVTRTLHEVARRHADPPGSETPTTAGSGPPSDPPGLSQDEGELGPRRLEAELARAFDGIDEQADHRQISATGLLDPFPRDGTTRRNVRNLRRNLESAPVAEMRQDVLGELYEELIPERERNAFGQFYTDPPIAEALVRWALGPTAENRGVDGTDAIPRVLDPAAGTGTFAVESYQYLADQYPDASHQALVDHVLAVDVNRFPLCLTALNLAGQRVGERTPRVNAYHGSFFDLDPGTDFPSGGPVGAPTDGDGRGEIGQVDAVVGNPPYIEAGELSPSREHFRAHLSAFGPADAAPYKDGANGIGKNADAYAYFVTHATRFLRDGGRLGFIIPTKWMMAKYGEGFQRFLHDHYAVEAVVGFDARAFGDALVDTALVLLEKCGDDAERRDTVVDFVQLHDPVTPGELVETIDAEYETPAEGELTMTRGGTFRRVGVRQSHLEDAARNGKIAHYLVAPEELIEIMESPALIELGEMADVTRGAMTGSTAFFFPDAADIEAHGIEDEFLVPALKSMRGYDGIAYTDRDVDRWFVDAHWYVEDVRERSDDRPAEDPLEERVKTALEADGYDGLRSWIRHAEGEGEHRGATCRNREVWFDFGAPPRPEILFQKLLRERLFSIYNDVRAVPSNAVDCIDVHPDVNSKVLFGLLNSSLVRAVMEVWGRNEAGMLQLMTYETASLPTPDVRAMTGDERARIVAAVDDILERGASDVPDRLRDRLDAAVLGALALPVDMDVEGIQHIQQSLLDRRIGSGEATNVLVRGSDVSGTPGTRSAPPDGDQGRSDDFPS